MRLLDTIGQTGIDFLSLAWIYKLLFFVLIFGIVFYSFLLTFRIRILSDTIPTTFNKFVILLSIIYLIVMIVGGLLAVMIILPA